MNQEDGFQLARALLLIGGIVAIAFGATALGSNLLYGRANPDLLNITGPLFTVVVGAVALVASSRIREEALAMALAILGFIAQGPGGILVAVAGVWAIISKHTLKASS